MTRHRLIVDVRHLAKPSSKLIEFLDSLKLTEAEREKVLRFHYQLDRARALASILLQKKMMRDAVEVDTALHNLFEQSLPSEIEVDGATRVMIDTFQEDPSSERGQDRNLREKRLRWRRKINLTIGKTKWGKPYLSSPSMKVIDFNYNVSHEGWFVIGASDVFDLIGVDVAAPLEVRNVREMPTEERSIETVYEAQLSEKCELGTKSLPEFIHWLKDNFSICFVDTEWHWIVTGKNTFQSAEGQRLEDEALFHYCRRYKSMKSFRQSSPNLLKSNSLWGLDQKKRILGDPSPKKCPRHFSRTQPTKQATGISKDAERNSAMFGVKRDRSHCEERSCSYDENCCPTNYIQQNDLGREAVNRSPRSGKIEINKAVYSRFMRLWSLKEAFVKARGDGLGLELTHIEFRILTQDGREFILVRYIDHLPVPEDCEYRRRLERGFWGDTDDLGTQDLKLDNEACDDPELGRRPWDVGWTFDQHLIENHVFTTARGPFAAFRSEAGDLGFLESLPRKPKHRRDENPSFEANTPLWRYVPLDELISEEVVDGWVSLSDFDSDWEPGRETIRK